jgi:hypothetical protein
MRERLGTEFSWLIRRIIEAGSTDCRGDGYADGGRARTVSPAARVVAGKDRTLCLSAPWVAFGEGKRFGVSAMSDYVVIYEQAEDVDWGAYLPDLPGVVALGAARSEVG